MIALDTFLFGLVAGLIGLKLALLATAAVLLVHGLTARTRQRRVASMPATDRRQRLDVHA